MLKERRFYTKKILKEKMKRCEKCGKRMWFFQELIMTTDRYGNVVIPILHDKCVTSGEVYKEKE